VIIFPLPPGDPAAGSVGIDPDDPPPGNVTDVSAKLVGGRTLTIRWANPPDADFDRIEITRTPGLNGAAQTVVYRGRGTAARQSGLAPGNEYQFVIRAVDEGGHRSSGIAVVVVGKNQLLLTPREGATLERRPIFRWLPARGASYYNLQLFRGKRKVGSWWPATTRFRMPPAWSFDGASHRFTPGKYSWYLWPGFGPLAKADYGDMLGQSSFKYE
jgi:hypothetical protein